MAPQKLSWITIPLIISLVMGVLTLLLLPFLGGLINMMLGSSTTAGQTPQDLALARMFTGASLWITGIFMVLWMIFQYLTLKAVQAGKSWGRIAAIVIAVLGILNFPIGTLLGIFMLIGAFDPDVQRYTSR